MVIEDRGDMTLEEQIRTVGLKSGARVVGIAAATEEEARGLLARRERKAVAAVRDDHWHVAQDLAAMRDQRVIVYPSQHRRAILS
jgi:hypothetical protein